MDPRGGGEQIMLKFSTLLLLNIHRKNIQSYGMTNNFEDGELNLLVNIRSKHITRRRVIVT